MRPPILFIIALSLHLVAAAQFHVSAWYFLRYTLPSNSQLTSLSGEMVIPPLNPAHGGTYYIWPGLQIDDWNGIYQNVLSGNDSGVWSLWSGYCCENPTLAWSGSFDTYQGETVSYSNVNVGTWRTVQERERTGQRVVGEFDALTQKEFKSAVFAIELYNVTWDFGPMTFRNIVITATGQDTTWCDDKPENYMNAVDYTISDVTSSANDTGVTCNIGTLVLNQPAKNQSLENQSSSTSASASKPRPTSFAGTTGASMLVWTAWGSFLVLLLIFCGL